MYDIRTCDLCKIHQYIISSVSTTSDRTVENDVVSLYNQRTNGPVVHLKLFVLSKLMVTSGLGLDDMSLAWPAVGQLLVFIYSGIQ